MTGLVIFDLDGVLIDSEVIASSTVARAMNVRGVAISGDEVIARHTGRQAQDIVSLVAKNHHIVFPDGFAHELEGLILADLIAELKPVSGMMDVLAHLDGTRWCVASNSGEARISRCLAVAGLTPRFAPSLFSAERVVKGKPAPDVYLHAAREMGVEPHACLVIEDTVIGVTAGKAAGMTVVGFLGGSHCRAPNYGAKLAEAGADSIAADSAALAALISLFGRRSKMAARLPLA